MTLNLLWTFLDDPDLNTDAYGPIVARLFYSDLDRKELIEIVEELREKVKQGFYSNYKANSLVKEAVNPLHNSIENHIMPLLAIIEESLRGVNPLIDFAKDALQEVLASTHEWRHSSYSSIQFGSSALKATDPVLGMRNKAISIVKTMLTDERPAVRSAAIEIAKNIGKAFGGSIPNIPLKDKIVEERQEMLEFIKYHDLISKETEWKVLGSLEDLLFGWWAHQHVPDEIVFPLLDKFKYDSEYRIFRYYTSGWDISENIRDKLKSAPSTDRWGWVVDNIMKRKWDLRVEDFDNDARFLNSKYPFPRGVVDFLHNLADPINISSANALFLQAWVKENPELFRAIRLQRNFWDRIPFVFKYSITHDLVQKYPELARAIFEEVLSSPKPSIDESKIAIDILKYDLPSIDRFGIITSFAEKEIDDLNLAIIEKMTFLQDKIPSEEMAEIVLTVLSHMTPQGRTRTVDHIAFILYEKNKAYITDFMRVTQKIIYSILVDQNKLNYHEFQIMAMLFPDIEQLLELV